MNTQYLFCKLFLALTMISITYQTSSEKIVSRLEDPNDDLVGLEDEITELF